MKAEDFELLVKERFERRLELSRRKRFDYTSGKDCLQNFKDVAKICKIMQIDVRNPIGVAIFFEIHKLYRKWNLILRTAAPKNESLMDNIDDQQNYIDLGLALLVDKEKEKIL